MMRFTVPPNPSASLSAVLAFNTSAPPTISGEIIFKSELRSLELVEGEFMPLIATELCLGSKPRIMIFCPSPPSRSTISPGRRPIASAMFTSGNSLSFSADTELMIPEALSCLLIAAVCPLAWALTTTSAPKMLAGCMLTFKVRVSLSFTVTSMVLVS